jgi:exopolysaccharide biosynthesis protein
LEKNEIDIFSAEFPSSKFSIELVKSFDKIDSSDRVSNLAKQKNAILAINGGFFSIHEHKKGIKLPGYNLNTCYPNIYSPYSALPSRILKINEKWYGSFSEFNSSVGWDKDGKNFVVGKISSFPILKYNGQNIPFLVLNKYVENFNFVVFTSVWSRPVPLNKKGLVITVKKNKISKIEKVIKPRGNLINIPNNGFVIYTSDIENKYNFEKGKEIILNMNIHSESNEDIRKWNNVDYILSGVPYLIKNGIINTDYSDSSFFINAHARTAICKLKNKNILFLVANGSDEVTGKSIGLGIPDLTKLMMDKGCTDAINLDGGHSSVFYFKGKVLNRTFPADEEDCFKLHERAVSDVIVVK